jgi:hypothetical protein
MRFKYYFFVLLSWSQQETFVKDTVDSIKFIRRIPYHIFSDRRSCEKTQFDYNLPAQQVQDFFVYRRNFPLKNFSCAKRPSEKCNSEVLQLYY